MTYDEILREYSKDESELRSLSRTMREGKLCKDARKGKVKYPCHIFAKRTTERHNTYIIQYEFRSKDDFLGGPTCFAIVDSSRGIFVIRITMAYGVKKVVNLLSPHLFTRYKERMNLDLTGIDVIKEFFKRNATTHRNSNFKRRDGDDNDVMDLCYDGAIYGQGTPEGHTRYNTFIDKDHMSDYRKALNEEYNDRIEDARLFSSLCGGLSAMLSIPVLKERDN
jgi:hypothetical protein